ncbi:hypothetical protein [Marinobacter sp. P4B1]|uniref:hypothetical protein n=1 Tax=Marinobacter sp. P4B1 TaxID=1119533 RepID=UPI00071D7458|nr:hypothetical protein [Marinobacter sp. P4B1]KRW83665.1 hypothetical protein AQ621_16585 [Marinobacter sp. P4B1]
MSKTNETPSPLPKEIDGIPIDPKLPEGFDITPNYVRPPSHNVWWRRPYITTDRHEPESYQDYLARLSRMGYEPDYSQADWEARQQENAKRWQEAWPEGVRYNLRCLDGGAWDRSTNYGFFPSLEAAVAAAKGLSIPDYDAY